MTLFEELSLIIAIAAAAGIVARLLRQPLIIGYIATGIVVGPSVLNLLHAKEEMELFSTIGISVLLFIVGLSLNPDTIREVGVPSLITGLGQVVFTSAVGFALALLLGFGVVSALYIAIALTFSSTIIILKLLADRGDVGTLYGKLSIGFLLVQDLVATLVLLVVSVIGGLALGADATTAAKVAAVAEHFGALFLRGGALAIVLYALSKFVLPRLAALVAHNQEVLFIFSMAWGLSLATLFAALGFSLEVGALIAGALLAVSPFAYEVGARLKPLRDFFIVIFFILLGAQMTLGQLGAILVPALVLSAFVLVGNPLIVIILMRLLGYRLRTAFMSGLTVAQISEFSLILIAMAAALGHVDGATVSLVTLVGIITITASTYLILFADGLYARVRDLLRRVMPVPRTLRAATADADAPDAVLFGYDYAGHAFLHAIRHITQRYLVVEYDPDIVAKLAAAKVPHRYGDVEDVEFLGTIRCGEAALIVSSIPYIKTNKILLAYYRARNPHGIAIVVANEPEDVAALYAAGATYVLMPQHIAAHTLAEMIERYRFDADAFAREGAAHRRRLISPTHRAV